MPQIPWPDDVRPLEPYDWRGYICLPEKIDLGDVAKALYALHVEGLGLPYESYNRNALPPHHVRPVVDAVLADLKARNYKMGGVKFTTILKIETPFSLDRGVNDRLFFMSGSYGRSDADTANLLRLMGVARSAKQADRIIEKARADLAWKFGDREFDAERADEEMAKLVHRQGGEIIWPGKVEEMVERFGWSGFDRYLETGGCRGANGLVCQESLGEAYDSPARLRLTERGKAWIETLPDSVLAGTPEIETKAGFWLMNR